MTKEEVAKLSNKLTLENIEQLIWLHSDRINVFIGQHNKVLFTGDLSKENPVCLNGASIQINMEYVDKKNSFLKQYKEYLK
tara:strand:- start:1036 stop:1278 length:243 start_codon:yes stop_codon:yes gene_type:complete